MKSKQVSFKSVNLEGLDEHDFDQLSKAEGNHRERKRYLAFAHLKDGKNVTSTAEMIRVSRRTLMNWVSRFRKKGIEGLKDLYGGGPKPHVRLEDHEDFQQAVLKLQRSRKGGRIRGKDVADLIYEKYGVYPSKSSVYDTLQRVGLVWITSRSRHPKADVQAQEHLKKTSKI